MLKAIWTVVDLLRSPAYAVPLVVNLTGSVWFFLLIGKAGEFFFCWGFVYTSGEMEELWVWGRRVGGGG